MSLKPGVYTLQNLQSDSVFDLSGVDRKTVIGFPNHGWKNQEWQFGKLGDRGWFIRSLYSSSSHYLTVEAGQRENLPVVATEFPVSWEVTSAPQEGDDIYWICWPNTQFVMDLSQEIPGGYPSVNLVTRSGTPQQLWKFIRCSDDEASNSLIREDDAGTTTITTTTKNGVTRVEQ